MEEDIKILREKINYLQNRIVIALDNSKSKKTYIEEMSKEKQAIENILNELERLQKENDRYKRIKPIMLDGDYELNVEEFLEISDKLYNLQHDNTCLHCGNDTPLYCEKCYQKIITKNAELQLEIEELKQDNSKQWKERCKLSFEVDDSIPKQKVRDKIEELKAKYNLGDDYWQYDYDVDMNTIDILEELSRE